MLDDTGPRTMFDKIWDRHRVQKRPDTLFGLNDPRQGIVHVGPEEGLSQPGALLVCRDSYMSTRVASRELTFEIGSPEVTHVLATHTL